MTRELEQESLPIQGHDLGRRRPAGTTSEGDGAPRNGGAMQDLFPDIPWEDLGYIETPDGCYLPETFDPHPFGYNEEELTGWW